MTAFRARLRPPKPTLWLGCTVTFLEARFTKTSKLPYWYCRVAELPFAVVGYPDGNYSIGGRVNVSVRWLVAPDSPRLPAARIHNSLLDVRDRERNI